MSIDQWIAPPDDLILCESVEVMPDGELTTPADLPSYQEQVALWFEAAELAKSPLDQIDATLALCDLFERHGSPVNFGVDRNGDLVPKSINEGFFAGLCVLAHLLVYEPDEKLFYRYEAAAGIYVPVTACRLKQVVSGMVLRASRIAPILALITRMRNDRILAAVVSQMRGVGEGRGAFAKGAKLIHLANCVLRITSGSFVPEGFSPQHFSRRRSPIAYDPAAACPRFLTELLGPCLDTDDQLLVQKMAGQFLLGDNLIQRLLIVVGAGGKGKTTLAEVLQTMLGFENVTELRTKHLEGRFELSRYIGRSLLMGVDVGPNFLSSSSASVVKALVGGERFNTEHKNSNNTPPMKGVFNVMITANCNLKVALNDDESAWRRRLLVVEFGGEGPVKKIPKFAEMLVEQEGPGILNWMLEGLRLLYADIEEIGDVRLSPDQQHRIDSMLGESDSVRVFLNVCVCQQDGCDLAACELVDAYERFCHAKGWNPLSKGVVGRLLPGLMLALGFVRRHDVIRDGKSVRGYAGVGFVASDDG